MAVFETDALEARKLNARCLHLTQKLLPAPTPHAVQPLP